MTLLVQRALHHLQRAVVPTLSSYGGPAAPAAEVNAAFDAAESEVVAAYEAAGVVANRCHAAMLPPKGCNPFF